MEILLILTYAAVATAIFKLFRIPLNKWTVPGAVLGGVVLVGAIVLLMNYNHPYSGTCRSYYLTTPIAPQVKGVVTSVEVKPNLPIKKGAILFRIDSSTYQYAVAKIKAKIKSAEKHYRRVKTLASQKLGSEKDVDNALEKLDSLKADLAKALFDLENTVVRAPTDGFVTQLILRPGMLVIPAPLKPVMAFIHKEEYKYIGWFRQNSLLRIEPNEQAEIAFDGIPGRVFSAKVNYLLPVIGQGQLQANGKILENKINAYPGKIPVVFEIDDKDFAQYKSKLLGGSFGQAAIYTKHYPHVAAMRKVLLRMGAWLNYVFPIH